MPEKGNFTARRFGGAYKISGPVLYSKRMAVGIKNFSAA